MANKKWKEWIAGIRSGDKLPKKNQLLILLLSGILLLVIVFPVPDSGAGDSAAGSAGSLSADSTAADAAADTSGTGEYEAYLEEKTAQTLRQVSGVGEVTVMITLKSGGQEDYRKGSVKHSTDNGRGRTAPAGRGRWKISPLIKQVYIRRGADGSSAPYVSKELSPGNRGCCRHRRRRG